MGAGPRNGAKRGLWSNEKGNVAIIFALALPIIAGGAGIGVESSYWYYQNLQIQAAADAAAFAGAIEKRSGATAYQILASAKSLATQNSFDLTTGVIEVNSPPLSGPNTVNSAVEVLVTLPLERYFSKLFVDGPVVVTARAVAQFETSSNACVLALEPSDSRSVLFSGNSSLTLVGCDIMANSIAPDAIRSQGLSDMTVDCLITSGGVDLNAHVTLTECVNPIVFAPTIADPFADLPVPTPVGGCLSDNDPALSPGNYCNGMSMNHDTVLASGTYFVSGGDFSTNGSADVSGHDVTIYLDGGARVRMNGNSEITLTAPTSGVYSGVLFFGDRTHSGTTKNKFNGTADSNLTGALYFASQPVDYLGNFAGTDGCTRIVALTIGWSGNTQFSQDCTHLGLRELPSMQLVRIAE